MSQQFLVSVLPPILAPSPLPNQPHSLLFSTSHLTYGQNLVITRSPSGRVWGCV